MGPHRMDNIFICFMKKEHFYKISYLIIILIRRQLNDSNSHLNKELI